MAFMKLKQYSSLPNDGFAVTACLAGVLNNKIVLGGGSGFKTPLLAGGAKLASASIRLLSPHGNGWTVHDALKVKVNDEKYGFCNGFSAISNDSLWYLGGLKALGEAPLAAAKDALRVWVEDDHLKYEVFPDVLPFGGELVGTQLADGTVLILVGKDLYQVDLTGTKPVVTAIDTQGVDLNGTLPMAAGNTSYFAGGYVPFKADDPQSNCFDTTRLVHYANGQFSVKKLINQEPPLVFLGASAISTPTQGLIVGGVDEGYFVYAIHNLSTLQGAALEAFRQVYFSGAPETFKFNKRLVALDYATGQTKVLGSFAEGYAGGANIVYLNGEYFVLAGEIKAGVRLHTPVSFTL